MTWYNCVFNYQPPPFPPSQISDGNSSFDIKVINNVITGFYISNTYTINYLNSNPTSPIDNKIQIVNDTVFFSTNGVSLNSIPFGTTTLTFIKNISVNVLNPYNTDLTLFIGKYGFFAEITPIDDPIIPVPIIPVNRRSLFTDNALIYYQPHSLSTGSGGVRNCRRKQRRT